MISPANYKIRTREITRPDFLAVADLLRSGFRTRSRQFWNQVLESLMRRAPLPGFPQYGYLLEAGNETVGVILQIFSKRKSGSEESIRCNVSSWFVRSEFRSYAALLVSKVLNHENVTYLNITAARHTWPILLAQKYAAYSDGVFVACSAIQPARTPMRILDAHELPDAPFEPAERELLLEHQQFGCVSLWGETPERAYPFVFRLRSVKGILPIAQLVYCNNTDDFVRSAGTLGRHLAMRGSPLVAIDANGPVQGLVGKYFEGRMKRFFKGPHKPALGDLAYTETAMFGI
jgi:hypothetical protein